MTDYATAQVLPELSCRARESNHAELVRRMQTIRTVETRLLELCRRGEAGDLHFSTGQEAISVGVCAALHPTDRVVNHHRPISHHIARGVPLEPLIAEVLGRRTGCNSGRAGEMHISNRSAGLDFSFQLVGTCIPVAVGLAWALKYHYKSDEIVTVFFGDATSSNGQFHEGLTIAAVQKVPLLLICENNHRAGNITPEYYLPTDGVKERMAAYGIAGFRIDGNDVHQVMTWALMAAERVRSTGRPYLLECETQRLCPHKIGQKDVRSKEELERLSEHDPLRGVPVDTALEAEIDACISRVLREIPAEFNHEIY